MWKASKVFFLVFLIMISIFVVNSQPVEAAENQQDMLWQSSRTDCYGPCINASVSKTEVKVNESVTVTGQICPVEPNVQIRVTLVRADLSYVDIYLTTDEKGAFNTTYTLDTPGTWIIYTSYKHMSDRLHVNVVSQSTLSPPTTAPPLYPSLYPSIATVIALGLTGAGALLITKVAEDKTRKISHLRVFIQIAFVFIIFIGVFFTPTGLPRFPPTSFGPHEFLWGTNIFGVPMPDGLPVPTMGCYYPCGRTVTCALWQIQAYIFPFWTAGHGWGVDYAVSGLERLAVVFGLVIVMSVVLGRLFCGWVCPFGLYMDLITRLRKTLKMNYKELPEGFNNKLHQLSYVIIAVILILSFVFGAEAIAGTELVPGTQRGQYIYQYFSAPFCQVCPMRPLCVAVEGGLGIIHLDWILAETRGVFYELGFYVSSLNVLILGLVTVGAFAFRRFWCRICPLGGLIALFSRFEPFKRFSFIRLDKVEEKCTKCGVCKRVCPPQITEVYEKKGGDVTTSACIMCLRCVEMCPYDDCLRVKTLGKTIFKSRNWLE